MKIKLIQQGINTFSPRIVQAVKYIERMQQERLVSVEALASELELTPTKTLLFPDKQPEVSKQWITSAKNVGVFYKI